MRTAGIHHLTAIAGNPSRNLGFYTDVLGLRLVKRTVNFDDPASYHLYFGDNVGTPGSILTFFSWPGAARGTAGRAQVASVSFAVAVDSVNYWKQHLAERGMMIEESASRFGEAVVRFTDSDGLMLELIATSARGEVEPWGESPIPPEYSIRGFAAPTLEVGQPDLTEKLLTENLGFRFFGMEGNRRRYEAGEAGAASSRIDVLESEAPVARIAVGNVHHIAFRATDEAQQLRWREQLLQAGFGVSPVMDRNYFCSIYFRDPGSILFEIATDGPGFMIDETVDALGETLKLPAAYEPMRSEIEGVLPQLEAAALS